MSDAQATIRVKKKDGTFVSLTPEEFAVYQGSGSSSASISTDAVVDEKEPDVLRLMNTPNLPPHFRPYVKPRSLLQPVPLWKKSIAVSEDLPTPLPQKKIPVQSEETKKDSIHNDITTMKQQLADHQVSAPLAKNLPLSDAQKLAPKDMGTHALSRTTPVTDIFVDEAKASLAAKKKSDLSVSAVKSTASRPSGSLPLSAIPQVAASDRWVPRHMEDTSQQSRKTKVADVQPPKPLSALPPVEVVKKHTTGPIDEIAQISCAQLRQFVSDPTQYTTFLIDKFKTLQEESYLLYLEAIDAFHESPIWRSYQQVVSDSLSLKQSVESLLSSGDQRYDGMNFQDFRSLVSVTSYLQV